MTEPLTSPVENATTSLRVTDWGLVAYQTAFARQADLVDQLLTAGGEDTLILVEHPPTVTLGRRASAADLRFAEPLYARRGVSLQAINRGGLATAHEPGQLIAYPVVRLKKKDVRWFAENFLLAVIAVLDEFDLQGVLKPGEPGVWVSGRKICSFGIALKKWVCSHGIALNVNNDLATFETIVPCGRPTEIVTSMRQELGKPLPMVEVKASFVEHFCRIFHYAEAEIEHPEQSD